MARVMTASEPTRPATTKPALALAAARRQHGAPPVSQWTPPIVSRCASRISGRIQPHRF